MYGNKSLMHTVTELSNGSNRAKTTVMEYSIVPALQQCPETFNSICVNLLTNIFKLAKSPASNPTPDEVAGVRINAGLTQQQAAEVVHSALRSWQHWENGDRRMHPTIFELFLLKTKQEQLILDPRCTSINSN